MDRYRILHNIVSGCLLVSVICLFLCGCGDTPPEPPPKPREVRKKIEARPGPPKTPPLATADISVTGKNTEEKIGASEPGKTAIDSAKPASAQVNVADGKDAKDTSKSEEAKPASAQVNVADGKGAKDTSKSEEAKPASAQVNVADGKGAKDTSKPEEAKPQPVQTGAAGDKDTKTASKPEEAKPASAQVNVADGKAKDTSKPEEVKPQPIQPGVADKDSKTAPAAEVSVQKTVAAKTDAKSGSGEVEKSDVSPRSDAQEEAGEEDETLAAISAVDAEYADKFKASYNPKGKVDPFEPLLREEPKKPENRTPEAGDETLASSKPKPPPRRLTPLEKLDLGQLKLVGIIRAESGNKALVEEASGKGYIIVKGTYIGIHSGIVVDILQDRVVVEEQDEDALGKVTVRKRELKFNRPEGEDYYEM